MILLNDRTNPTDDTWTERTVPTRGEVLDKHALHGVSDRWDVQELAVRSA